MDIKPIYWEGDLRSGCVVMLDQTLLPKTKKLLHIDNVETVWEAIRSLRVRGAPAIGIAAALGLVLGIRNQQATKTGELLQKLVEVKNYLATARPTAVNLFWALERMYANAEKASNGTVDEIKVKLWREAQQIFEEDVRMCYQIGANGEKLIKDGMNIITHCNAGGLATSGYGTALAVIFSAFAQGKKIHVYADETRPLWQGARLTTWELQQAGIPVTLICDNTAAFLMQQNKIDMAVVGADRIAANGDVANKIGTYGVAISAFVHKVPFFVAAPVSTFDFSLKSGQEIPIEERAADEIVAPGGKAIAPDGVDVYSPAFDVTPAKYLTGIITEQGILHQPLEQAIAQLTRV